MRLIQLFFLRESETAGIDSVVFRFQRFFVGFGGFCFWFGFFFVLFRFWNKEGVTRQNLNEAA